MDMDELPWWRISPQQALFLCMLTVLMNAGDPMSSYYGVDMNWNIKCEKTC